MDALLALETHNMSLNSSLKDFNAFKNESKIPLSTKDFLQYADQALLKLVFPYYCTVFPKHPSYETENQTQRIKNPLFTLDHSSYKEYRGQVAKGERPVREGHGTMHASRVTLWALLLSDDLTTLLTVGMHDTARQDEATDRWDHQSGFNLRVLYRRLGIKKNKEHIKAIRDKENSHRNERSEPAQVVYDVDCLEIIRCIDPSKFDSSRLHISERMDPEELAQLVHEVKIFILLTESLEFKTDFELKTEHPLLDLLHIIKNNADHFPYLTEKLKVYLAELPAESPQYLSGLSAKDLCVAFQKK